METLTFKEAVIILIAGVGGLSGIITFLNYLREWKRDRRRERLESMEKHLSDSATLEQVRLDGIRFSSEQLQGIIIELRADVAKLKEEVAECEKNKDLILAELNALRAKFDNMK